MKKKYYYVYKIINKDTNEFYIGMRASTKSPTNDLGIKYFSSSKTVKSKILEYGSDSFKYIIVDDSFLNLKDAYDVEQRLIFENWGNELLLNKACYYGKKDFGIISEDAKQLISKSSHKLWNNSNLANKIIAAQKKSWTNERKLKQSIRLKTEFWTDERRKSHSEKMKGHVGCTKLKGIKKPKGFGKKVSNSLKGLTKSEEHKAKISIARSGKIYPHSRKLSIENIKNIKERLELGDKVKDISLEYNISQSMVYRIKNGVLKI